MNPGFTQKKCPSCGAVCRTDLRFCTSCGKPFLPERACSRCGTLLPGQVKFCPACGAPADQPGLQQAEGQKKSCPQCRAVIDSDAKFCNKCGTVLSALPVCPRCRDPVGPNERFCGVCGLPLEGGGGIVHAPPSQKPPGLQPAVQQKGSQPAPEKKSRGLSAGKIIIVAIIGIAILAGVIMMLPESPPPSDGGKTPYRIKTPTGEDAAATASSVDASRAMLSRASQALSSGDSGSFATFLAPSVREKTGDNLPFTTEGAQKLASGLANAKVMESTPGIIYYQMDMGGKSYTFYTVNEGEKWLIGGL